jgi:hypothetical protein
MRVIRSQEEELGMLLDDHNEYLTELERTQRAFGEMRAEQALLGEYNAELERQVE